MGLSRNKVAVSEGAAGSPPFYGERGVLKERLRMWKVFSRKILKQIETKAEVSEIVHLSLLFNFQGLRRPEKNRIIEAKAETDSGV